MSEPAFSRMHALLLSREFAQADDALRDAVKAFAAVRVDLERFRSTPGLLEPYQALWQMATVADEMRTRVAELNAVVCRVATDAAMTTGPTGPLTVEEWLVSLAERLR